ncbi:MAG: oligoribonuclease [Proteobacteria bacterium]|nr:oligoribonuclease [Pseudomonadota bacterium]
MTVKDEHLIWIDLEMTGLNVEQDRILEIATVMTDSQLNILEKGPVIAIHQSEQILNGMDQWNQKHHGQSGLVNRVRESTFDERSAEMATLNFLSAWVPAGKSPICGNSICQDRRFLYKYMPKLENYFHYRNLDVSTIKILVQRWSPALTSGLKKSARHQALQDIIDSIEELKYYRQHFIRC